MKTINLKKVPKNKWIKWVMPSILVLAGLLMGTMLSHPIAKNQEIAELKGKLSTFESKVSRTEIDLNNLKKSTSDWTSWTSDEQQLAKDTVQKKRAADAAKEKAEQEAAAKAEAEKKAQEEAAAKAEAERMAPYINKIQQNPFMGCTLDVDYINKELDFTLHDRDILYIEPEEFGGKKDMEAWGKFVEVFVGYSSIIPSDYTVVLDDSNGSGLLIAQGGKVKLDLFSE